MTTNDKSDDERLEEIKKEEKEDASSYYAGGDSHEKDTTESDMNNPIEAVNEDKEEMSLLKAVAFLGFGMAAIAIVFMLFFLRGLDERVLDVDSTVNKLDAKFAPFKKEVDDNFARVDGDFEQLKEKVSKYERMLAIMELKRAMVSIQEVTNGASPEVRAKAGDVLVSIKTLLQQLGEGPAGEVVAPGESAPSFESVPEPAPEPAPEAETSPETTATAEPAVEEEAEEMAAEENPEEENPEEETPVGKIELESGDENNAETEDEEEEEDEDEE